MPPQRQNLNVPACRLGFPLIALALFVAGCGANPGDVSGKVYFKGKVVTSGFVTLVGSDGAPKQSPISEDGSYKVAGVASGDAKVAVSSPNPEAKSLRPIVKRGDAPPPPSDASTGSGLTESQKKSWREIPADYGDITKGKLKYTVKSGENSHDIKID